MAIEAPSVGTMLQDDTGTTHTLSATGVTVTDGRILLKCGALENLAEALTDDDGDWNELSNINTTVGSDRSVAVWWKLASSESGDYSFGHATSAQGWGIVWSYPNVDQATPEDTTTTTVHLRAN